MKRVYTRKEREVWQACQELFSSGLPTKKITIEAIGNKLISLGYKKGSFSDISLHKRSWLAHYNIGETIEPSAPAVTDRITVAATALRQEVLNEAAEEVAKITGEAEEKILEAKLIKENLSKELDSLKTAYLQLRDKYDILEIKFIETDKKLFSQNQEITSNKNYISSLECERDRLLDIISKKDQEHYDLRVELRNLIFSTNEYKRSLHDLLKTQFEMINDKTAN